MVGKVVLIGVEILFVSWLAVPQFRNATINIVRPSEDVTVTLRGETAVSGPVLGSETVDPASQFQMVALLGFDAIPVARSLSSMGSLAAVEAAWAQVIAVLLRFII